MSDSDAEAVTLADTVTEKLPLKLLLWETLAVPVALADTLRDTVKLRERIFEPVVEHVPVSVPDAEAVCDDVSDGLAVTLRLLDHVPVTLKLPDGDPVLEKVPVKEPERLKLHEALPLPDLVRDRLVHEKLADDVLETECDVLSVSEPVKLKLRLADDVREANLDNVPVELLDSVLVPVRLELSVALVTEELTEIDHEAETVLVPDELLVRLTLLLLAFDSDRDIEVVRVRLGVRLLERLPVHVELEVWVAACSDVAVLVCVVVHE